jgi:PTH1 family peptidyl-tRNA hydrolase
MPLTFMNNSGSVATYALRQAKLSESNLVVVCDNLDLPPGSCRLKRGGGHAGHNGLKSVISHLGSTDFLRLYVGIGHPGKRSSVVDWVLGVPGEPEKGLIQDAVERAAAAIISLLTEQVEKVMNELNTKN